ncbi:hypothetical protein [Desulfobacterium sp. N47]|uniref:Uncharacterized protein n=1 Tax=uncultured Desulfobacterium sp. TaxID=201089 RepID=E1YC25_9BACT|nr:unknown protein [uncultured Desulfobacterium sp.]
MNTLIIRSIYKHASFVISVAAIVIAFRSCVTSTESLNVARGDYNSKRHIVLICNQESPSNSYVLSPHRPDTVIINVNAVFPKELEKFAAVYDSGGFLEVKTNKNGLKLIQIDSRNIDTIRKAFDSQFSKIASWFVSGSIPVILHTSYIIESDRMTETAIYSLSYTYVIEKGKSRLEFGQLEFTKRLIGYDEKDTFRKKFGPFSRQPYRLEHLVVEVQGG